MTERSSHFDVVIIGGGPAGLSAALWCGDLGLETLLLEKQTEFGGQLLNVYNRIENYLGLNAKNGRELCERFAAQIDDRKFSRRLRAEVCEIDLQDKIAGLATGEKISAKALIIATGVRRKSLGIEGEDAFIGKGMLESGQKDKELTRGKQVLIVGGGDAAFENALLLSGTAEKVWLAHRSDKFRARQEFIDEAKSNKKIEILTYTIATAIEGSERVESVRIEERKSASFLQIDAVLVRIGVVPNTELLGEKLELGDDGYVKVNSQCETSVKGVYAVGDVANPVSPTVSTAVGSGATAAKAVFAWLNSKQDV